MRDTPLAYANAMQSKTKFYFCYQPCFFGLIFLFKYHISIIIAIVLSKGLGLVQKTLATAIIL